MQSEAYKLTGFTAVASALGFLLRWLQNMQILEAETGLAVRGKPISFIVAAVIVIMAAALIAVTFVLRRCSAPAEPEKALAGKTFLFKAICIIPTILMAVSGLAILFSGGWPERQVIVWRLCGITAIAAAVGLILVTVHLANEERAGTRRLGIGLMVLFAAMWLIAEYKSAASDPVVWRFAVEILAICAALMAFYYVAGYFFGEPSPRNTVFFCYMGGFLCIMSAVDEHTLAESILFCAVALILLTWGYVIVSNMRLGDATEADAAVPEE